MNFLPIGGLYATYHLLGEPETTIEKKRCSPKNWDLLGSRTSKTQEKMKAQNTIEGIFCPNQPTKTWGFPRSFDTGG